MGRVYPPGWPEPESEPERVPKIEMRPAGNKTWRDVTSLVVAFDGARLELLPALAQTVALRHPEWRVDGAEYEMCPAVRTGPGNVVVRLRRAP